MSLEICPFVCPLDQGETIALSRVGLETGPLSVWLWNELKARGVPIACMDARHANAAWKMMLAKTDRNDAMGLAQIFRTGWCKSVHVKSMASHEARTLLATRSQLAQIRCDRENQIKGVLRTFGVLFGRRVGGFAKRAEEMIQGDLNASPTIQAVVASLMQARTGILEQIRLLNAKVRSAARQDNAVQARLEARRRLSQAHLCEAANALLPRIPQGSTLKSRGCA